MSFVTNQYFLFFGIWVFAGWLHNAKWRISFDFSFFVSELKIGYRMQYISKSWSKVTREELSWLTCWRQNSLRNIWCKAGTHDPPNDIVLMASWTHFPKILFYSGKITLLFLVQFDIMKPKTNQNIVTNIMWIVFHIRFYW